MESGLKMAHNGWCLCRANHKTINHGYNLSAWHKHIVTSRICLKMKRKMTTLILIVIAAYLLLLWDFTATFSNTEKVIKVEYNGVIWVGLDYWSIWKYKSEDKPMKWIKVTRS